ncbi:hypothetical protein JXB27_02530 [Candidatus Woesearchaeota archaeon]|nr:hypothetical protein [Candidatus Woesearchaeota archaeon]
MAEGTQAEEMIPVPKSQLEQLVAMARVGHEQMEGAQREGAAPTEAGERAEPEKPTKKKKQKKPINFEEEIIRKPAAYLDGLVGSTVRSAATSYSIGLAAPLILMNPLIGLPYAAIMGGTSYVLANISYKMPRFLLTSAYNIAFHPLKSIGKVWEVGKNFIPGTGWFKKVGNFIQGKISGDGEEKEKSNKPVGLTGFLFKPHNENALGKIIGSTIGFGAALKYLSPGTFDSIAGKISDVVVPKVASVAEGTKLAGEKLYGLADATFSAGKTYFDSNIRYASF